MVLAGIVVIAGLLYWVTSFKNPAKPEVDKETEKIALATGFNPSMVTKRRVYKMDFGANWPFIPDSGTLIVTPVGGVYFMEDNYVYAVNGTARSGIEGNPNLLDLPFSASHRKETNKDSYVSLSVITDFGLSLIGIHPPKTSYFTPEPEKEPDVKYGLPEAQRKQIFLERWDEQYNARLAIAKLFLYQEYSSWQKGLEKTRFREIDQWIMKKYNLDEESYRKIDAEGNERNWNAGRKSFSYSWQETNSFPE